MIIAGNDRQLFYLRMLFRQDPVRIDRVLGRCQGLVFHDHPLRIHAVFNQPFRHFPGFRRIRILCRGSAAGADKQGIGILFGACFCYGQPFNQFILHTAVRIQLKAEHDHA